jgi:hypothetical protein
VRAHGTRACYVFGPEGRGKGCRCYACRVANARAVTELATARRPPWRLVYISRLTAWGVMHRETHELVLRTRDREKAAGLRDELNNRDAPQDPVWLSAYEERSLRRHLRTLAEMGLSNKAIARAAGVNPKTLVTIRLGYDPAPYRDRGQGYIVRSRREGPKRIRRSTAERILAVSRSDAGNCDLVDATDTWALLDVLCRAGYPKAHLAELLGYRSRALQIQRLRIAGRTERKVRDLYKQLWRQDARVRLAAEGATFPRRIRDRHGTWRLHDDSELVRLADARLRKRERDRIAKAEERSRRKEGGESRAI